jgi:hypothetical protein
VDDITISSTGEMTEEDKRWGIAQAYGMIGGAGFKPKREKHQAFSAKAPITIMGLNANSAIQPTLTKDERAGIRAQVFQLKRRLATGDTGTEFLKALNKASGKVGRLTRLHKREGAALHRQLAEIRCAANNLPVRPKVV